MSVPSVDEHGVRRASKRDQRGVRNFGRLLLFIAATPFALGLYGCVMGALMLRWPQTQAKILGSDLRIHLTQTRGPDGTSQTDTRATVDVAYAYSVNGRDYTSGEIEPYTWGMQNSALSRKHKERYPKDAAVPVAYNPDNPAIAYLEPRPSATSMMFLGIGLIMGLSGLYVLWCARRGIGRMAT
jgi:hypothetical protein